MECSPLQNVLYPAQWCALKGKGRENRKKRKQCTCRRQNEKGEESFTKMLKENKFRLSKVIHRKRMWGKKSELDHHPLKRSEWWGKLTYLPWSAASKQTLQQNLSLFPGTSLALNLFILSCHTEKNKSAPWSTWTNQSLLHSFPVCKCYPLQRKRPAALEGWDRTEVWGDPHPPLCCPCLSHSFFNYVVILTVAMPIQHMGFQRTRTGLLALDKAFLVKIFSFCVPVSQSLSF